MEGPSPTCSAWRTTVDSSDPLLRKATGAGKASRGKGQQGEGSAGKRSRELDYKNYSKGKPVKLCQDLHSTPISFLASFPLSSFQSPPPICVVPCVSWITNRPGARFMLRWCSFQWSFPGKAMVFGHKALHTVEKAVWYLTTTLHKGITRRVYGH